MIEFDEGSWKNIVSNSMLMVEMRLKIVFRHLPSPVQVHL